MARRLMRDMAAEGGDQRACRAAESEHREDRRQLEREQRRHVAARHIRNGIKRPSNSSSHGFSKKCEKYPTARNGLSGSITDQGQTSAMTA